MRTPLATLIRDRRQRHGISQEDLARQTHTSRSAIDAIEGGRTRIPTPEVLNAIANVLPVTVEEMLEAIGYAIAQDKQRRERQRAAEQSLLQELRDLLARRQQDDLNRGV